MRIFSDLDLVERSGYGVPKIINIYGKEVFEITDNFIRVILPFDKEVMRLIENEKVADKPEKVADKSEKVADKPEKVADKSEKVADKSQKVADKPEKVADKSEKVADKLNKTQELILKIIKKDPYIKIKDLMSQLLLSDFGVRKCLKYLKDNNLIYRVGSNKNGYWIVNDDVKSN